MTRGRLEAVASTFESDSETLHKKFLAMLSDVACAECSTARFGEAILPAWLQTKWSDFTRELVIASAQGTRRTKAKPVQPVAGVKSRTDAEKIVKAASTCVFKNRGLGSPVWHAPWFVIDVGTRIGLKNLPTLQVVLGSSVVPEQIADFRNYLFHPGERTRSRYEELQEKLGMLHVEPEDLPRQQLRTDRTVFTSWVRELQRVASASTQ